MKRIKEVIELMEITGDKCVILHKETSAYVVMSIEEYRRLVEYTEKTDIHSMYRPDTDIKQFEVENDDVYYPEPME
ncbi:hypothetical protein HOE31_02175 [bacterium]|jgi:hypothetical protein|nr:hypothetical protein [bacterium]MBT4121737.1 hypothetical protein [bacterium]MBT4335037.1 hypothetical protein [bacterium]MBT4495805.1 hypothetical protein [bacterium]MBT4763879.1 hypothetical protein [bacterium]